MRMLKPVAALLIWSAVLASCGTVQEKTAPCKRPANLTSFAEDPRRECPGMRAVNDPTVAFAAIGIEE
ncbi:hypothetical protein [Rhizobium terrae]|uniref:hypothetical protein n=1 Tax=Rhizobium terrae TaxID=2171756 RepID=UPI001D030EDA|nr:hypothetical protein [Rhizobium terrae]